MKYTSSILLASAGWATALTQQCTGTAIDEGGNWFCGAVKQIMYEGIVGSGSYQGVTNMDDSGTCSTAAVPFSGSLAPLNEDLSLHIRGPFNLKEVAVYHLASESKKRAVEPASLHVHARRHGHAHFHEDRKKKRAEDWVIATINGQRVSWINNYFGPSTEAAAPAATQAAVEDTQPTTAAAAVATSEAVVSVAPVASSSQAAAQPSSSAEAVASSSSSFSSDATGDWERTSYYNAEQQVADNVVFLGNYGGQGSGVWDTTWGNSLSYLNAEGNGGASAPEILGDVYIPSNTEFAIFSAEKCDSSCGYARAPDVAYKGFAGANKIFLFNFKMPLDGDRGFNGDMPALWALNGRIPRTMQYGSCSCWSTGCGEADIYEVLASGDTKCKSTFHLQNGAGSSDYFERPTENYIKVATIFDERTASVTIKQLPDDFDFATGLSDARVKKWISEEGHEGTSLFQLS